MKSLTAAFALALAALWASPALASEPKKDAPKAAEKAASGAEKKVEKPKREKKGGC